VTLRKTSIVLVHGVWNTGLEATLLRRRLAALGAAGVRQFRYRSVRDGVDRSAERLEAFLARIDADALHLVGHSLGGLVILRLLETRAVPPPGRVVLLGVPVRGSAAAQGVAAWPGGRWLLGRSAAEALLAPRERRWNVDREIGVLAGTGGVGIGRLLARLEPPHDGTVTVAETEIAGATDRIVLPVTHSGMLFSAAVAQCVARFVETGRFRAIQERR